MASKKGIGITIVILAVITGASFLFWIDPQETKSTFVISDYENYLDGVKNIHEVLQESVEEEFADMKNGRITAEEYIKVADVTTSQVSAKISEFVTSKPPEQWQESYINYMEALKRFNSYVIETKVYATLMMEEKDTSAIAQKIEDLQKEAQEFVKISDELRP